MKLHKILKEIRKSKGLGQVPFGKTLGMLQPQYSKVERSDLSIPAKSFQILLNMMVIEGDVVMINRLCECEI